MAWILTDDFFFKNQLLFWYSFRNVWEVFSKFWIFQTKLPYLANTYSSLWELFPSRKEYFLTVITPLLLSLLLTLFEIPYKMFFMIDIMNSSSLNYFWKWFAATSCFLMIKWWLALSFNMQPKTQILNKVLL